MAEQPLRPGRRPLRRVPRLPWPAQSPTAGQADPAVITAAL